MIVGVAIASITLHLFKNSMIPINSVCFLTSPRYAQQLCAFSKAKSSSETVLAGCEDDPACSVVFSCSDIIKPAKQTKIQTLKILVINLLIRPNEGTNEKQQGTNEKV